MTIYMGIKKATVLIQVKGSRLVKTFTSASPIGHVYHLIPGPSAGAKAAPVTEEVAEKIKSHPLVTDMNDGLFPGRSQTWGVS